MAASSSPRLALSYGWSTGENSWGAPFNVDLLTLDALLHPWLLSITTTAPPGSPTAGDTYYVPASATGAWAGQTGKIACYQASAWKFYTAPKGMRAWVVSATAFYYWNGTAWTAEPVPPTTMPVPFVISGKPAAGATYNAVIAVPVSMPANFVGTVVFDSTQATANSIFTVKKIAGGTTTTTIGTVTVTPTSKVSATLSTQALVNFAAGDVLQLVAPATQDTTLSDIGITFLMNRT